MIRTLTTLMTLVLALPGALGVQDDQRAELRERLAEVMRLHLESKDNQAAAPDDAPAEYEPQARAANLDEAALPTIKLVASRSASRPGEVVAIDVFLENVVDLRGYQVALEVTGGQAGRVDVHEIAIDTGREDYVFDSSPAVTATDSVGARLAVALFRDGVQVSGPNYLGTFQVRASADAKGRFSVTLRAGQDSMLRASDGEAIPFRAGPAAVVNVQAAQPTSKNGPALRKNERD